MTTLHGIQPSFTFPSRRQYSNLAVGLNAEANLGYVTTVPQATNISQATTLWSNTIVPPTTGLFNLDPDTQLPISQPVYIQPNIQEGLTQEAILGNNEDLISKTLSANNALNRGNYATAENILGRALNTEEIQNKTLTPNPRANPGGGPDTHVTQGGALRARIQAPNYQHLAHMVQKLGSGIDHIGEKYGLPRDQIARLKARYNLFHSADPNEEPDPDQWKHMYHLVQQDLDSIRSQHHTHTDRAMYGDNARHLVKRQYGIDVANTSPSNPANSAVLSDIVQRGQELPLGDTTQETEATNRAIAETPLIPTDQLQQDSLPPTWRPIPYAEKQTTVQDIPLTNNEGVEKGLLERIKIQLQANARLNSLRSEPLFSNHTESERFIPAPQSIDLANPQNWSAQTQIQNPPSLTEPQWTAEEKQAYLTNPRGTDGEELQDYESIFKGLHNAPMTAKLMARTGPIAVPISAQVQIANQGQQLRPTPRIQPWNRSKTAEDLTNQIIPPPAPPGMVRISHGKIKPGMDSDATFPRLGRYHIDTNQLQKGIIALFKPYGTKKYRRVPYKHSHIIEGSGLHKAIIRLTTGGKTYHKKLSKQEHAHLEHLKATCGLGTDIAGAVNMPPLKRLKIYMGEIEAGNNNPHLKIQLHKLLQAIAKAKLLGEDHISTLHRLYLSK